jgi:hypothetical protein
MLSLFDSQIALRELVQNWNVPSTRGMSLRRNKHYCL